MERNLEMMKQKKKDESSKINEQEFITIENTPEKQKASSTSGSFTMYKPLKERSPSIIIDKARYKTPTRQEIRDLRIPKIEPIIEPVIEPAIKPIKIKSEIKQLDKGIELKNNELGKIIVEKNNAPHGLKGKFDDSIKKLRQEIKSLTLNKEIRVNLKSV